MTQPNFTAKEIDLIKRSLLTLSLHGEEFDTVGAILRKLEGESI